MPSVASDTPKPATGLLDVLDAKFTQSLMRWNDRRGEIIEIGNSPEAPDSSKAKSNSYLKG